MSTAILAAGDFFMHGRKYYGSGGGPEKDPDWWDVLTGIFVMFVLGVLCTGIVIWVAAAHGIITPPPTTQPTTQR
jgi:hypothetical protein